MFPLGAAIVWGCVMWLFRHERDVLQPSLKSSMQYLYDDSESWTSFRDWFWYGRQSRKGQEVIENL